MSERKFETVADGVRRYVIHETPGERVAREATEALCEAAERAKARGKDAATKSAKDRDLAAELVDLELRVRALETRNG